MKSKQKYWIKRRDNPQLDKPYFITYGKITKKRAMEIEHTIYGYNTMLSYDTEEEYKRAIEEFRSQGISIVTGKQIGRAHV